MHWSASGESVGLSPKTGILTIQMSKINKIMVLGLNEGIGFINSDNT